MIYNYIIRSVAFLSLISLSSTYINGIEQENPHITWGVSERQGKRPTMEDAYCAQDIHAIKGEFKRSPNSLHTTIAPHENYHLYGIFDGHGGTKAAQIASVQIPILYAKIDANKVNTMLKESFTAAHKQIISKTETGTTAVVALIRRKKLYIAWAGDSRAVLEKNGTVDYSTEDHKPDNPKEKAAIEARGGYVATWGVPRVQGSLAVARALGDNYIAQYITAEPEIKVLELTPENNFLILACDGVWDVLSNEEAIAVVKDSLAMHRNNKTDIVERTLPYEQTTENGNNVAAQLAAQALIDAAYTKGSPDNISALIVVFDWKTKIIPTSNDQTKNNTSSLIKNVLLACSVITVCYGLNTLYHWLFSE